MNPTGGETFQRSDRSVGDRGGAYGGHDAFGKNDPFGGLGFGGRGYADVVDSFDKAVGITRTVRDRQGNITGQASWSGNQAPNQSEFGIDGVRSDGRGTGDTGMGDGGSRGDGSYSESSGYNDNNPQGIL